MCKFLYRIYHLLMVLFLQMITMMGTHLPQPVKFFPQKIRQKNYEGTGWPRTEVTELGVPLVTYIAHTTCSMPTTVLISCRSTGTYANIPWKSFVDRYLYVCSYFFF